MHLKRIIGQGRMSEFIGEKMINIDKSKII